MIDRACILYEIEVWANEDFFRKGSLYDGELVWEQDSLVYVVFDVVMAKGCSCAHLSYRERLHVLHTTILCVGAQHADSSIDDMLSEESKLLARNNLHNLRIVPKKCVPKASLGMLWDERLSTGHRTDGLILTQNSATIQLGTTHSILKWKPHHSIDISAQWMNDSWHLFGNSNNGKSLVAMTNSVDVYDVQLVQNKLLDALKQRSCIVECVIHVDGMVVSLVAERERTDKTTPNTMTTIEATIRNSREDILCSDLAALVGGEDTLEHTEEGNASSHRRV
tara:strand:- start:212 stop:1051 length:840 start_codon:yes stop_codon:yes gene_type:complete